jgi:methyl-accepting chemotaxis protein
LTGKGVAPFKEKARSADAGYRETAMPPFLRRKKLIQPRLQLRLIGSFTGLATLAMLLQFLFLGGQLMKAVGQLDDGGGTLADAIPGMLIGVLGISLLLFLPIVFILGLMQTNKIAGPAHRFEMYLRAIARGEQTEPCRIRAGDELQSLCDAINEATSSLRRKAAEKSEPATKRAA